jgi:hypothetical protein
MHSPPSGTLVAVLVGVIEAVGVAVAVTVLVGVTVAVNVTVGVTVGSSTHGPDGLEQPALRVKSPPICAHSAGVTTLHVVAGGSGLRMQQPTGTQAHVSPTRRQSLRGSPKHSPERQAVVDRVSSHGVVPPSAGILKHTVAQIADIEISRRISHREECRIENLRLAVHIAFVLDDPDWAPRRPEELGRSRC